jgi:transposase
MRNSNFLGCLFFRGNFNVLKEDLHRLWRLLNRKEAERFLFDWIRKALSSGIYLLYRFAKKLRRYAVGILNYFDSPISTAKVKRINNRFKVAKRKAYGFRNMDYFMLKIYNLHTWKG